MKLKALFKDATIHGPKDVTINGLCANSKVVAPGNLYVARRGKTFDGNEYIPEALAAGASAILTDLHNPFLKTTQVIVPDVDAVLPDIARAFYPSDELFTVGITGTNGKTITSYLVRHLLGACGLMGTIECDTGALRFSSELTTPDLLSIHKFLHEMKRGGCKSAVLEVTSHAIDQGRVQGIDFDVGIFTNLTQDHLDYHETMEHYADAKAAFFATLKPDAIAILNADCPWMSHMMKECHAPILTYGVEHMADIMAEDVSFTTEGTHFTLVYQDKRYSITSPLLGCYNISNLLAALAVGISIHHDMSELLSKVATLPDVPGRLEHVPNMRGVLAFVDFAHTPEALKKVLRVLGRIKEKRIITVFGCGGDRDKEKRALMGTIACEGSDHVIITTDNPRREDPHLICGMIAEGALDNSQIEVDRKTAIIRAISMAEEGDILLIAGRGHEKHQIHGNRYIAFDDVEVAKSAFSVEKFNPAHV